MDYNSTLLASKANEIVMQKSELKKGKRRNSPNGKTITLEIVSIIPKEKQYEQNQYMQK